MLISKGYLQSNIQNKMIDRLPQLKKVNYKDTQLFGDTRDQPSDHRINGSNIYQDCAEKQGVGQQFFEQVKTVRNYIESLNKNNYKIAPLKARYAKAIKSQQQKLISQEMNEILQQNAANHKQIKTLMTSIQTKVTQSQKQFPEEPETRMKKNFYLSLTKEITSAVQKQQTYETQYKQVVKEKVVRQVRIIQKDADDEKIEQYIEKPQLAQEMLQRKIYGQASVTLKNTINDIQDKFRDIKKLQTSVVQCVQLFQELSLLAFAQGQKIDSIEANVATANYQIKEGEKKLKKAKQHHKSSKKCKCIAIIVGLVILIIVIIIVVATTASKK